MSSVRSHFRHRAQQEQSPEQTSKPSSRIPTKATSVENGKPAKPTHHAAKLAKKSRSNLRTADVGKKSTHAKMEVPVTAVVQPTPSVAKRISMPPPGAAPLVPPSNIRTPSLFSGSSASTFDSPRSALRRKPSGAIDRYAAQRRDQHSAGRSGNDAMMLKRDDVHREVYQDTVLGLSLPPTLTYDTMNPYTESETDGSSQTNIIHDFSQPALGIYAPSVTPSTRYTDSPFSHAPTPSSVSSYSSSVLVTSSHTLPPVRNETIARKQSVRTSLSSSTTSDARRSSLVPARDSADPKPKTPSARIDSKYGQSSTGHAISGHEPSRPLRSEVPRASKLPSSATQQRKAQIPPELAHLNVDVKPALTQQKSPPPARPSREGISTISDMTHPSSVVQSDLPPLYTTYHKRTPSQDNQPSSASPSLKSRFGFSRSSSRTGTPRIDSAISPPPSAHGLKKGTISDPSKKAGAEPKRKDSPAVGSTLSPEKSSRFGLFSRKTKSEPPKVLQKPRRQPSKGPAAGTGHEGYGRFGVRGRSGSVASSSAMSSGVRSPSSNSSTSSLPRPHGKRLSSTASKSGSEHDDFLRERLNPIILRGGRGSMVSNTTSSSVVRDESVGPTSSVESLARPRLLPSVMSGSSIPSRGRRPVVSRQMTSDSSDDEYAAHYPSIATRRSMTRMSSASSRSPVRMPAPIQTNVGPRHASIDSSDAEVSAWPQTDSTLAPVGNGVISNEGLWLRSPGPNSTIQTGRKWNFSERAIASPRSKGKDRVYEQQQMPDAFTSPYTSVVHYAMLGPVAPVNLEEAEQIALEFETSADESMSGSMVRSKIVPYERRHVSLLPPPQDPEHIRHPVTYPVTHSRLKNRRQDSVETFGPHAPIATVHQQEHMTPDPSSTSAKQSVPLSVPIWTDHRHLVTTPEPIQGAFDAVSHAVDSPRQPRLSPVGRIPRVVSRRDRDRKLSDNSFSRPFARSQPRPSVKPPGSIYNQIRDMASPIEAISQPVSSTSTRSGFTSSGAKSSEYTEPSSNSTNRTSVDARSRDEFIAFPRKYSEQSNSSSSNGHPSWMSALAAQQPQEEDVWHEYNDLMDEVMPPKAPLKTPTTGSSLGAPFQYSSLLYENAPSQWPPYSSIGMPPTSDLPLPPRLETAPPVLSVPQQISRFLQPSLSPLSPDTITGFIGGYGNRSTSTLFTQRPTSGISQQRLSVGPSNLPGARESVESSRYSNSSVHSRSTSLPERPSRRPQSSTTSVSAAQSHDVSLSGIAEIPYDKRGVSTNLRLGALMTSKWLSFGRVLFSPAHNEMQLAQERRVLVVDGLSSDWSYYIALSYPSAEVYNLTPSMPGSPSFNWPDESEKPPSNHRQIPLGNIATPFPFPKGFFTAVVFRFPSASTETAYSACIAECKRVLRPGGFLEVAVLDLDLMNMGTMARSAVRGLKTRMQQRDSSVCLRNLSDVLVSSIGRRGFDTVQRCIVGVPAAGRIPRSQDLGSDSSCSSGKALMWRREHRASKSQEISFADLLADAQTDNFGPGQSNDESITKMVARVGRWWYSSCYEKALLPYDQSIWSDRKLLRECEKQGTSFRLLICHAQKPAQTRRRTVSV